MFRASQVADVLRPLRRLLAAFGLSAVVAACGADGRAQGSFQAAPEPTDETLNATSEWRGQRSDVAVETVVVVTTDAAWTALWRKVGRAPPSALPDGHVAVGIFLGQRNTGGFTVEIVSAGPAAGEFVVGYEENRPTGMVTMSITYPWLIRLFPDPGVPVRVEKLN